MLAAFFLMVVLATLAYAQQPRTLDAEVERLMASRYQGLVQALAACDANVARQSWHTRQANQEAKKFESDLAKLDIFSDRNRKYVEITSEGNFVFFADGKEIGRLTLRPDEMSFSGNADESARVFFDVVISEYQRRVKELERQLEEKAP